MNSQDLIVDYLLSEGLADNIVSAKVMATHMSDEWRDEILTERRRVDKGTPRENKKDINDALKSMGRQPIGGSRQSKKTPGEKNPEESKNEFQRLKNRAKYSKRMKQKAATLSDVPSRYD